MERRKFRRAFTREAVKLGRDRGMTVAQAERDLGVHGTLLRRWGQEYATASQQAFPRQFIRQGDSFMGEPPASA